MKIFHTETQADYDALMVELEEQGRKWASGRKPTESKDWVDHKEKTGVVIEKRITRACIGKLKFDYPDVPIQKYKAKADEKMKFTKENIEELVNKYFDDNVGECPGNLIAEIYAMDDTPEKVVVPKCFDEWFKEIETIHSIPDSAKTFALWKLCRQGFGHGYEDVHGKKIPYETDLGEWLFKNKMLAINAILNGYTIERERFYCIPLPHLETACGTKQYLTKSGAGNYFALSPCIGQKQRYTKEELEQVPEIYKPFAKLIEEEDE